MGKEIEMQFLNPKDMNGKINEDEDQKFLSDPV
jgi:hypothetical protein